MIKALTRQSAKCSRTERSVIFAFLFCAISLVVAGCGGGGGSNGAASSQVVQGTVAAPGGALTSAGVARAAAVSTNTETGVPGLTVTVGTVTPGGTAGTFTFTPITGATTTSASDGSFSVTLPAGTQIAGNTVVVASTGDAPATLPVAGVLVTPVFHGKLLVDPVTTSACSVMFNEVDNDGVRLQDVDPDQTQSFLQAAESAASTATIPSGSTLTQVEEIEQLKITGDAATGITLSGIIVSGEDNDHKHAPKATLTSGADFTTAADNLGNAFNGASTEFTADHAGIVTRDNTFAVIGTEQPTATTPRRSFEITIPSISNLTPGTYTASITYSEATTPSTTTPPAAPADRHGFGPGDDFFDNESVSLWSAQNVNVTVTAGAAAGDPVNVAVDSATYSPVAASGDETNAALGTFTTGLTGTVSGH
jgi:hypothetical protein